MFLRKAWSFTKEVSGYNDVKRAIQHPSFFTIGMAALNFIPVGKVVKVAKVAGTGVKAVQAAKAARKMENIAARTAGEVAEKGCKLFCFAAGTQVQTDNGLKNIEDISVGDKVLSMDEDSGNISYKLVEETFTRKAPNTFKIYAGNDVFEATAEHPFWVKDQGWVTTQALEIGNQLVTKDEKTVIIRDIIETKKETKVYNLHVADYHTFFVGSQGIWTHNCGGNTAKFDSIYTTKIKKSSYLNWGGG